MKLEQLIQRFCPDGVEYKTIGEIAIDIFRGSGIKREQITEAGIPCVRYGELYTTYGVWFDTCVSHTDESAITNKKYFEHGDVLFAITGESVEDIAKCSAYIGHERCLAGGDIVVLRHRQDPKYLSYALSTTEATKQKSKGKVKSKVVHSSVPAIKALVVPIPPLEVQQEIVRILDQFTELTAELNTQLTAELIARKQQYEYYRDELLTFGDTVEYKTTSELKEDSFWLMPATPQYVDTGIPYITSKNIKNGLIDFQNVKFISEEDYKKISSNRVIQKDDLLITMIGTIGEAAFVGEYTEFYGQNMYLVRLDQNIINRKFFYYFITSDRIKNRLVTKKNTSSQGYIKAGNIENLKIPLPPIEEQNRIVSILDRFDTLCNDLTSGLPAEIESRRKQYEYYRDKLLNFEEKN